MKRSGVRPNFCQEEARQARTGVANMHIVRAPKLETWLIQKTKDRAQRPAPRRAHPRLRLAQPPEGILESVDPLPMTDDESLYFAAGQGHHVLLLAVLAGAGKGKKAWMGVPTSGAVSTTPDFLTPHPIEIKTTRSKYGPKSESPRSLQVEYEHYLTTGATLLPFGRTRGGISWSYIFQWRIKKPDAPSPPSGGTLSP